jgi:hypothetical protein
MESIRNNVERVKSDVSTLLESESDLSRLTLKELDEILSIEYSMHDYSWDEKRAYTQKIKDRYMNLLTDEAQVDAILHWKDHTGWATKIDIGVYKQRIIEHVNRVEPVSHNRDPTYETAWSLIRDDNIVLTPKDICRLDTRFIKYAMSKRRMTDFRKSIAPASDNEEDACDRHKAYMTPVERFCVNFLMSVASVDDIDAALECLGHAAVQKKLFLPQKLTVFEDGDILPHIIQHYNDTRLSPMIRCRRNVGIIMENMPHQFYDFQSYSQAPFFASRFAIEFPYMCYVLVDRVEIDLIWSPFLDSNEAINCCVDTGDEYIMRMFGTPDKALEVDEAQVKTVSKTCTTGAEKPCHYLTVSFNKYRTVVAIRVYGKAISLI